MVGADRGRSPKSRGLTRREPDTVRGARRYAGRRRKLGGIGMCHCSQRKSRTSGEAVWGGASATRDGRLPASKQGSLPTRDLPRGRPLSGKRSGMDRGVGGRAFHDVRGCCHICAWRNHQGMIRFPLRPWTRPRVKSVTSRRRPFYKVGLVALLGGALGRQYHPAPRNSTGRVDLQL